MNERLEFLLQLFVADNAITETGDPFSYTLMAQAHGAFADTERNETDRGPVAQQ